MSYVKTPILIEHIGSTAVPNLGGKGIIDIAIAAAKTDMDTVTKELQDLGYAFRPTFSTAERYYFVIYLPDPEEGERRYHVHLTYPENIEWFQLLGFRDYLKTHPKETEEYAQVKKQAVAEGSGDGDYYRNKKNHIITKIHRLISNPSTHQDDIE